jgi:hypothetical protein
MIDEATSRSLAWFAEYNSTAENMQHSRAPENSLPFPKEQLPAIPAPGAAQAAAIFKSVGVAHRGSFDGFHVGQHASQLRWY